MAGLKIKGINPESLTEEQKAHLIQILGIKPEDITEAKSTTKEVNNLVMKEGSETIAIDPYSGEEFDISQLSDEDLKKVKKTGMSLESLAKLEEAEKIKALMKGKTINRGPRNAVSAAQQVMMAIENNQHKITSEVMKILTDISESKKLFKLAYPLFIEIPSGASDTDKKEMRKVKGANRFGKREWLINDKYYFMTNDIYMRNVPLLISYFDKLPAIEIISTPEPEAEIISETMNKPKKRTARKSKETKRTKKAENNDAA